MLRKNATVTFYLSFYCVVLSIFLSGCVIVKSGSDFRMFSEINIYRSASDKSLNVGVRKHEIKKIIPEDKNMKMIVDKYMSVLDQQLEKTIGETKVKTFNELILVNINIIMSLNL